MKALVISAHPDDETLGCGGVLLKHRSRGDEVAWIIMTQPWEPMWSAQTITTKVQEVHAVAEAYGFCSTIRLGFGSAKLDTVPMSEKMARLGEAIAATKPEVVYLPHRGDVHTDHEATFMAALSVLKPIHMARLGVRRVLSYECISSTDAAPPLADRVFLPTVLSDVSAHLERKLAILGIYASECHQGWMPRTEGAVRALARTRGATMGVEYAEALCLVRELL